MSKSKLVILEEVLERYPGEYDSATVRSVRDLVTFVEENSVPYDKIPYHEFRDFPEFSLFFNLMPQWRYKPKEYLLNDEKYGGKYFMAALKSKCKDELGLSGYRAERALDSLIVDFNHGTVIRPGSLRRVKIINAWDFINKKKRR